jgi:hypothetical protein
MLYVMLLKMTPGGPPMQETLARRMEWEPPEGMHIIAEYWPQTPDPAVIAIFEADSAVPMMAVNAAWGDAFQITVFPAMTAEDGLEMARQMMQG